MRSSFLALLALAACESPAAPAEASADGSAAPALGAVASAGGSLVPPASAAVSASAAYVSFREQRKVFATKTTKPRGPIGSAPPVPPPASKLARVKYKAPLGDNWAYITPDPKDGKKHPAVVYATGGFDFSIEEVSFEKGPIDNDQSGARLRTGGAVVMYPSYRGVHDNAGTYEMLYGEVDDYLAALAHVQALPYVDPARIFLVGHSTGGTLVLLAAALTDGYRAALALGPVASVRWYDLEDASFDTKVAEEWDMRSPIRFVRDIKRPVFVVEGLAGGNVGDVKQLAQAGRAAGVPVAGFGIANKDHFSVIAPTLESFAKKIDEDTGAGDFAWEPPGLD